MRAERLTVTIPPDLIQGIDRVERNRSKFIQEAVRHELERRRRDELYRSLRHPHPETREYAELGFDAWAARLSEGSDDDLVDADAGTEVRWSPEKGWREVDE